MRVKNHVSSFLVLLIVIIFSCIVPVSSLAKNNETPNIMMIHSYDLSYQWTKKQDEGFRKVILSEYPKANIYTEVLDAKRIEKEYIFNDQMEAFVNKYNDLDMDIILATDDMGVEFALEAREKLEIQVPIAFSGVLEKKVNELVGHHKKVTGVFETRGFTRMIELMRLLQPEADRVVVINDTSSSSRQMVSKVQNGFEALNLKNSYEFDYWEEKPYQEILNDVKELNKNTAVYLISYHKSFDGVVKTGQAFSNEISEASSVPMYSLGELYFGSGVTGGEFLSGNLQGQELASIALEIINGKDVNDIPYSKKSTSYLGVDENMLRKYGIENVSLPEDTVIINENITFFEEYKTLVVIVTSIFFLIVLFILMLLIQRRKINRTNGLLKDQKKQLQSLYEQVSASEEELLAQNEELLFYQEKLQFEADHDYLTGLNNRESHEKIINDCLHKDINRQRKFVFAFVDLDNFKYINNRLGHHSGDVVLKEIARRLESTGGNYSVARLGGDEFIVVYEFDQMNIDDVVEHMKELLQSLFVLPVYIGTEKIHISASMGCSFYPEDATIYDELIIKSDLAMYEAKRKQKGMMVRFNESIEKSSERFYKLGSRIKNGIDENEFYLVYQPIVTSDGLNVKCLEALLRWESKEFGSISPVEFIQAAEASGHMIILGDKVFEMAFSFLSKQRNQINGLEKLSINISVNQLHEEGFVLKLLDKLKEFDIDPKIIQLEVVESVMIYSYDIVCDKLEVLKQHGISIALDDFGTGYSSLSHLNRLPIDTLKIDKRFIDKIGVDEQANHIIKTISVLAKSLNLFSVAEGVETESQAEYLKNNNITYLQGYLYSKPLKEEDALVFLQTFNNK